METEKIFENGRHQAVRLANSAVYAMQVLQSEMRGEAERAGLASDDEVIALVKELREENAGA